jgi:hypothetical protein
MAEILAFVLASLNKKDDLKDKLFYVPQTILERLKKIQQQSLDKSKQIENDKEQKKEAIKDHVKTTGNYSNMFCIGDGSKNIECIDERVTDERVTDERVTDERVTGNASNKE